MSDKMALKAAVDLLHVPSQVRLLRSEPLPDGVLMLLRIAAGETEVGRAAANLVDRSPDVMRQAATFFIEQILFAPDADSYRVLGATAQAGAGELRRNVALLLRWLHPDLDPHGERSLFIGRVTAAWNDLKTPERRAAYDEARNKRKAGRSSASGGKTPFRRSGKRRSFAGAVAHQGKAACRPHAKSRGALLHRALSMLFRTPQT
jgi:hypothetical protein